MSYATEDEIKAIKAVEKYKMVDKEDAAPLWLKMIAGLLVAAVLFFTCRSMNFSPLTAPAVSQSTTAPTATPWPLPTIQPTEPAPAVIAQATAVPPTTTQLTPTDSPLIPPALSTYTPAATYTPYPTGTAQATYTPPPTQTPAATLAALVVTRLVPYPVEVEPAPFPIGWLVAAVGLGMTAVIIGLMAVMRRPVSPPPIVIQQPAVLPTPAPQLTPLVLRRNEPVTSGLTDITSGLTDLRPVTEAVMNRPGMVQVGIAPVVEVDEPTTLAIVAVWNKIAETEKPSLRKVCFAYFGSRNDTRHAVVRRAIEQGREWGIVKEWQGVMA